MFAIDDTSLPTGNVAGRFSSEVTSIGAVSFRSRQWYIPVLRVSDLHPRAFLMILRRLSKKNLEVPLLKGLMDQTSRKWPDSRIAANIAGNSRNPDQTRNLKYGEIRAGRSIESSIMNACSIFVAC